ncbi:MAG: hypothetical protein JNK28_02630 [Burkholderiaceae bacterium]|nr:hypothetical protein [Burkholderiaceae bacterium]
MGTAVMGTAVMGTAVIRKLSPDRLARLPAVAEIHQGRRSVVEDLLSPVQTEAAETGRER